MPLLRCHVALPTILFSLDEFALHTPTLLLSANVVLIYCLFHATGIFYQCTPRPNLCMWLSICFRGELNAKENELLTAAKVFDQERQKVQQLQNKMEKEQLHHKEHKEHEWLTHQVSR